MKRKIFQFKMKRNEIDSWPETAKRNFFSNQMQMERNKKSHILKEYFKMK